MPGIRSGVSKKRSAFTLIESLVFLFLFAVVSMAFLETYSVGSRLILESKNRLGAIALANQKMEVLRSVDYDSVGTKRWNGSAWVYGIPPGDILEEESLSVNTRLYKVKTFIQYVDHPYDGTLGGNPNDVIPTDQKRVRLTITWGEERPEQEISLVSTISPDGVESSLGGGVLSINVLNAAGIGVPNATVRIVNSASSIDVTAETDSSGNILLPGAPAGSQNYSLTVSKSGYYGAVTYPPYPTTAYNPTDVHASVAEATLNQKTIVSDLYSDIRITTADPFGSALPDIDFSLIGGRVLGTDPLSGGAVYGFNETGSSDSSGVAEFSAVSHGQYAFTESDSRYVFYKFDTEESVANILDVTSGTDKEVSAILLDSQIGSLLLTVKRSTDDSLLSGAVVRVTGPAGYDVSVTTDLYGQAYFPSELPALPAGDYGVEVSVAGFATATETLAIAGSLVTEDIILTPQ